MLRGGAVQRHNANRRRRAGRATRARAIRCRSRTDDAGAAAGRYAPSVAAAAPPPPPRLLLRRGGPRLTVEGSRPGAFVRDAAHHAAALQTALVAQLPSGALWDLNRPLAPSAADVELLTFEHPAARDVFWHSSAHVLGAALERLYGDRARLCDGPTMCVTACPALVRARALTLSLLVARVRVPSWCSDRGGFFYEFALEGADTAGVSEADLRHITQHALAVIATRAPFERLQVDREVWAAALTAYASRALVDGDGSRGVCAAGGGGGHRDARRQVARTFFPESRYKQHYLDGIPATEPVTLYRCGSFVDLCRGPHLRHVGQVRGPCERMWLSPPIALPVDHRLGRCSSSHPHRSRRSRPHGSRVPTGSATSRTIRCSACTAFRFRRSASWWTGKRGRQRCACAPGPHCHGRVAVTEPDVGARRRHGWATWGSLTRSGSGTIASSARRKSCS